MSGLEDSVLAVTGDLGQVLYPQIPQFLVILNLQASIFQSDHSPSISEPVGSTSMLQARFLIGIFAFNCHLEF